MEEIYREINSLGDIVDESVMGSPSHNPGGGSGGTLTNTQRAIQDALTLLKHRVAYFMQDNLTSLFKGHDLLLPRLDDTDNTATGKIHLNSGSLEREWDVDDGRINNHPPLMAGDQISPISRNEEHKSRGRFEERKGIIQSESNTERRLLQELMKVDEAVIQREPNESIDKFRMSGHAILSSKQRTRHFSDTISTSRQRARENRAQAPDLMTRTRSSQAQELADFLDDQLQLGLGMSRHAQGRQPSSNQLDFNNNLSPVSLATPNSPQQALAGAPQRQSRAHPKVPPIAGLLQMREQEESKLRFRDIPQVSQTPQSSSTAGLNQGFLNQESESKLIESEPEDLPSAQLPPGKKASDNQTAQSGGSHLDSNMLRFIRKVQDSLEQEQKGGDKLRDETDLTQQLSEYLNIDLNKLSLSQRERVVYSMINPQYHEESLINAQMEVRLEDLLKVSRSGSEFKLAVSGENSGHNQAQWMPGEAALAHIESVGDAMAQKLIIQYGLESNKSKKSKGRGGGRQMDDTQNSEPLNTNGEFDEEVRGIVERAGILQKLQQQTEQKNEAEEETERLFQDKQRRLLKKKFNQVQSSPPKDQKKDNMFKARRGSGAGVLDHKQEENFLGQMQQIAKEFDEHPSHFQEQFGRNNVKSTDARRKKKSPFPRHQLSPLDFAVIGQHSVEGKDAPFEEEDSLMQEISHLEQLGNQVRHTRAQMHQHSGFEPLFSRGHYERQTLAALEDQKRKTRDGQSRENTVAMRENALIDLKLSLERNNARRGAGPRSPDLKRDTDIEIPISQIEDISPHSIDRKSKKSRRLNKSPQNLSGGKGVGRSQESAKSGQLSQKAREAQRRYLTPDLDNQGRQQVPFKGKVGKALQKNILALNRKVPRKSKQNEVMKQNSVDVTEQTEPAEEHHSHQSSFNSEASRFLKRREAQSPILTGPVPMGSREDSKMWGGSAQSSIGYPPTNSLLDVNKSVDSALMRANFQAQLEQGGVQVKQNQRKGAVGQHLASPKIQDHVKAKSQIRSAMGYYENHNFGGASFQHAIGAHKQQGSNYPTKTPMRASVTPQNMVAYSITPPGIRATPGLKSSTVMSQYKQNQGSSSQQKVNSFIQEEQRSSYTSQGDSQGIQSPGMSDSRPSIRVKKRSQDTASRFKPIEGEKSPDIGLPGVHGPQPPSRSFDQAQPESSKKRPGLLLKNFVRGPPKFHNKAGALKRPSSAKVSEPPQLNKHSRPSAPVPGERRQDLEEQKLQPAPFHHVSPNIKYQKPPGSAQGIGSPQQPYTESKRPLLRGGLKFQSYGQVVSKSRISSANAGNRPVQKIPVNAISFISAQSKMANNSSMLSEQQNNLSMQEQPYQGKRPRAFERHQFKLAKPGRLLSGAGGILDGIHKQQAQ